MKTLLKLKQLTCFLLSAMFIFMIAGPMAEAELITAETMTLEPIKADGVTITPIEMDVLADIEYGIITFRETKQLSFTASFDEGWTYNSTYSTFFPNNSDRTSISDNADGSKTFVFTAVTGETVTADDFSSVGIYASASQLPKLEINIGIPFSQVTKETWVDAEFTLTMGTKKFSSGDYSGTGSIKGRGNTSWDQPKKPYSIKLSEKKSLLDIPKTKKYAIVPGYSDQSLMRNFITYKAGLMFNGIEYTPKCEFVEVYLNGVYNGIYILVERVEIEGSKIDIEEAGPEDLTGGYLIEKDIDGKIDYDADQWFNCPYWANQSQDFFVLKTPESDDSALLEQMLAYLEAHMQKVHDSIMGTSGESYTDYVDVDSWIDFILMQEITKNIDGNLKTSCYMYKQSGDDHIYMTAIWDFDLAYGIANWDNASYQHNDYYDCPNGMGVTGFMAINSSCPWFDHLYDDYEEFREALIAKYNEYRETMIPAMRNNINAQAAYLSENTLRNDQQWGTDFAYGVSDLKSWFNGRIDWLDRQWYEGYEAIDLDLAMNADGGNLHFETEGSYPFIGTAVDGRLAGMSGNAGADSTGSSVSLTLNMYAGETLSFEYRVSSEQNYDKFKFSVNGTKKFEYSGEIAWTDYTFTASADGSYTFIWEFTKDYSVASGSDCAWIDNVSYSGQHISYQPGDVDMDGQITLRDSILVTRYALGLIDLSAEQQLIADVNGSGSVDSADAIMIARWALDL